MRRTSVRLMYSSSQAEGGTETSDSVELMAPDGAKGREFGWSVALSGDTLVVGAPYTGEFIDREIYREEDAAEDKTPYLGSAYVYTKSDSGWEDASGPAKLTASNGIPWTQFGWSVSVSGDTVAVGAPGVRWSLSDRGAYMFTRPSEGWRSTSEQGSLPGLDGMHSFYGSSISVSGDVIVIGASDDETRTGRMPDQRSYSQSRRTAGILIPRSRIRPPLGRLTAPQGTASDIRSPWRVRCWLSVCPEITTPSVEGPTCLSNGEAIGTTPAF